jgi:hypothetical protein
MFGEKFINLVDDVGAYLEAISEINEILDTVKANTNLEFTAKFNSKHNLGLNYDNIIIMEKTNGSHILAVSNLISRKIEGATIDVTDYVPFFVVLQLRDTGKNQYSVTEFVECLKSQCILELPQTSIEKNLISAMKVEHCPKDVDEVNGVEVTKYVCNFGGGLVVSSDELKNNLRVIVDEAINLILLNQVYRHTGVASLDRVYYNAYEGTVTPNGITHKKQVTLEISPIVKLTHNEFTQYSITGVMDKVKSYELNKNIDNSYRYSLSGKIDAYITTSPDSNLTTSRVYRGLPVFVIDEIKTQNLSLLALFDAIASLTVLTTDYNWANLMIHIEEKDRTFGSLERLVNSLNRENPALIDLSSSNFSRDEKYQIYNDLFVSNAIIAVDMLPHSIGSLTKVPLFKIKSSTTGEIFKRRLSETIQTIAKLANVNLTTDVINLFKSHRILDGYFISSTGEHRPLSYIDAAYLLSNKFPTKEALRWQSAITSGNLYEQAKILSSINSVHITGVKERIYIPSALVLAVVKLVNSKAVYKLNGIELNSVNSYGTSFTPFDITGYAIDKGININNSSTRVIDFSFML